jgi:hypothetical protein
MYSERTDVRSLLIGTRFRRIPIRWLLGSVLAIFLLRQYPCMLKDVKNFNPIVTLTKVDFPLH